MARVLIKNRDKNCNLNNLKEFNALHSNMKFLKSFPAIFFATFVSGDGEDDCKTNFLCTTNFCTSGACSIAPLCSGQQEKECKDGELMRLFEDPDDFCECCPKKCVKYIEEGATCQRDISRNPPDSFCGPQLGKFLMSAHFPNCFIRFFFFFFLLRSMPSFGTRIYLPTNAISLHSREDQSDQEPRNGPKTTGLRWRRILRTGSVHNAYRTLQMRR